MLGNEYGKTLPFPFTVAYAVGVGQKISEAAYHSLTREPTIHQNTYGDSDVISLHNLYASCFSPPSCG